MFLNKIMFCLLLIICFFSYSYSEERTTDLKTSSTEEVVRLQSTKETNGGSFSSIAKEFCNNSFPVTSVEIPQELFDFGDKTKPSVRKISYLDYDFYFLMPISIKHDRFIVRGFSISKKDNSTTSLYLYKSKSDGGWRSSLYDLSFEKGTLYAQGTKIVPEVETILDKCVPVLDIEKDDPYMMNIQDLVKNVEFHDYFKLLDLRKQLQHIKIGSDINISIERDNRSSNVLPLYEYSIPYYYTAGIRKIFFQEITLHFKKMITTEQDIVRPCMPKNFDNHVTQYNIKHTLLGETIVFVYDGKCVLKEGESIKNVRWHIAYQSQSGKAWVHQVESTDDVKNIVSKSTNIATFANVINVDLLALKPLDYNVQVRLDQESIEMAFEGQNINLVPYDDNYVDITAITTKLSPVKEFLEFVQRY